MSTEELINRFIAIGELQSDAIRSGRTDRYNALFDQLLEVERELAAQSSDGRRVLMPLYGHPTTQVRLNAAKATLAIAPAEARRLLESIRDSREQPYALDAGMCLRRLTSR